MKTAACYSEKCSQLKTKHNFVNSKQVAINRKCFVISNVGNSCVD
jgi:hypothetical protein